MTYRSTIRRAAGLALLALPLLADSAMAQATPGHGDHAPAIRLFQTELGRHHWPVTTAVQEAQAYFDQGLRLMYAYDPANARLSFEAARQKDPRCALCWWGEAWSVGPYFNGGMRAADVPAAFAAIQRAQSLAATTSPVEQALIEAMRTRYLPEPPEQGRRGLDSMYAAAMAHVYSQFPDHLEVATLYADALMVLEPRRGVWPLERPSVALIHQVLERALAQDVGHPGACHAYIHATETTPKVGNAQPCADLLSAAIPGASHINHMPSHTYNRVGRWGDATRSNIDAWHTDQRAGRGEAFAIYPSHNLHMLLFSAAVDGQGAIAAQAARDYTRLAPADGASFQALVLVRFGRFDEVLALLQAPSHPVHHGLWAFSRGLSRLRLGAPDSARAYLALVDSLAAHTPPTRTMRAHRPDQILGIVGNLLRGELLRSEGNSADALAAFEAAVQLETTLVYDEPEPLPFLSRDFLGALLLEIGRAADAVAVYEAALVARPNNGWSLFGLEQALRVSGRTAEADQARARFQAAWVRSDSWLTASRF
jgi:hypothetical protein